MGLLDRIFKPERGAAESQPSSGPRLDAAESRGPQPGDREATRRELVQVCVRETIRRHAIPSEWIKVRILPVVSRRRSGMHLQLIVKQGQRNLLTYIPAFQSSLMAEIEKFDPQAADWLLSISWQFAGITSTTGAELPSAAGWAAGAPGAAAPATAAAASAPEVETEDADVMEDLQALFAIRDAALRDDPQQPDFEPTRPGFVSSKP